jgi:hypothetical protein
MNTERENLVSMDDWKNLKKDACFSDYLKVLSFNDLMIESNFLVNQMKENEETDDFFSKTKLMMSEFSHRLEKESKHLAHSVKDFKNKLEDKLH